MVNWQKQVRQIHRLFILVLTLILSTPVDLYSEGFRRELSLAKARLNGGDIKRLQQNLFFLGYTASDNIDGWYGETTRTAVIQFQKKNHLKPDGIVNQVVWDLIESKLNIILDNYNKEKERINSLHKPTVVEHHYEEFFEDGPPYPIGTYLWSTNEKGSILKIRARVVGDLHGYEYFIYFRNGRLFYSHDYYWRYNTESDKEEQTDIHKYFWHMDTIIAEESDSQSLMRLPFKKAKQMGRESEIPKRAGQYFRIMEKIKRKQKPKGEAAASKSKNHSAWWEFWK